MKLLISLLFIVLMATSKVDGTLCDLLKSDKINNTSEKLPLVTGKYLIDLISASAKLSA